MKYKTSYNSNKANYKTFLKIIIKSCYRNLINKVINSKQINLKHCRSLADKVYKTDDYNTGYGSSSKETLIEDLLSESSFFMSNQNTLNDYEQIDLQRDVLKIINKMPEDLKTICRLLQDDFNIVSIANKLKLSRKTIYKKINQIKVIFKDIL